MNASFNSLLWGPQSFCFPLLIRICNCRFTYVFIYMTTLITHSHIYYPGRLEASWKKGIVSGLIDHHRPNWRRQWHPTPIPMPGKSHGQRSLEGCSPGGRWGSDTTERLHFNFSLSCIGEGNGNPLQCSCLENPRDGGAWWAAISGVAQSRTRLKRLRGSSSSSSSPKCWNQKNMDKIKHTVSSGFSR